MRKRKKDSHHYVHNVESCRLEPTLCCTYFSTQLCTIISKPVFLNLKNMFPLGLISNRVSIDARYCHFAIHKSIYSKKLDHDGMGVYNSLPVHHGNLTDTANSALHQP